MRMVTFNIAKVVNFHHEKQITIFLRCVAVCVLGYQRHTPQWRERKLLNSDVFSLACTAPWHQGSNEETDLHKVPKARHERF